MLSRTMQTKTPTFIRPPKHIRKILIGEMARKLANFAENILHTFCFPYMI